MPITLYFFILNSLLISPFLHLLFLYFIYDNKPNDFLLIFCCRSPYIDIYAFTYVRSKYIRKISLSTCSVPFVPLRLFHSIRNNVNVFFERHHLNASCYHPLSVELCSTCVASILLSASHHVHPQIKLSPIFLGRHNFMCKTPTVKWMQRNMLNKVQQIRDFGGML